jgi:hypothetical protein
MKRRARSIWERLAVESSMEGPTVTFSLPREVAQELVGVLMGSLEMAGDVDGIEEPDSDDPEGTDDGHDGDPLTSLIGGDDDADDGIPGLSDSDDEPDDDADDDDDDDPDEAIDYGRSGGSPSGLRTQTALGERRRRR